MAKSKSSRSRGGHKNGAGFQTVAGAEREQAEGAPASIASTTAGHNMADRARIIQECKAIIDEARGEAAALQEKVKAKNKLASNQFRRLKTELGMKRDDAEFALRLVDLKEDERNEAMDAMREIFSACGKGEQLDWIKANDTVEGKTVLVKEATAAGREAGRLAKLNITDNPHPLDSAAFHGWNSGYLEGNAENAPGQAERPTEEHREHADA